MTCDPRPVDVQDESGVVANGFAIPKAEPAVIPFWPDRGLLWSQAFRNLFDACCEHLGERLPAEQVDQRRCIGMDADTFGSSSSFVFGREPLPMFAFARIEFKHAIEKVVPKFAEQLAGQLRYEAAFSELAEQGECQVAKVKVAAGRHLFAESLG